MRGDSAVLAICLLLPAVPEDIAAKPLLRVRMQPVEVFRHPIAALRRTATPKDLKAHI